MLQLVPTLTSRMASTHVLSVVSSPALNRVTSRLLKEAIGCREGEGEREEWNCDAHSDYHSGLLQ